MCDNCNKLQNELDGLNSKLIEIRKTNIELNTILKSVQTRLEKYNYNIFDSITDFFYSFFKPKKEKYKDF